VAPGAPGRPVLDAELRHLAACVPDQALVLLDHDGTILTWNPGAQTLTGHDAGEMIGAPVARLYPPEAVAAGHPVRDLQLAADGGRRDEEAWRLREDGSRFWARVVLTALLGDDGRVSAYGLLVTDLTARQEAQGQAEVALDMLRTTVRTDPATGFLNRRGWDEALRREVALAERRGLPLCVATLEASIDDVAPRDGETVAEAEDRFLRQAGAAWGARLRATDVLARTADTRFAVVLVDCDVQGAMAIVERMRAATPGGIVCTAGVACWDEHEGTAELIERADDALRAARAGDPRRTVLASADREIAAALGQAGGLGG
jgi:PAS domain S-box-containing protein/diguanylate cyclase (GGDEF)-like protein